MDEIKIEKKRRPRRAVREHTVNRLSPGEEFFLGGEHTDGAFVESIKTITAEELGGDGKKSERRGGELISYIFDRIVFFAAVAVFVYCCVRLVIIFTEQTEGDRYYEDLVSQYSVGFQSETSIKGASVMRPMTPSEVFIAGVSKPDSGIVIDNSEYNEEVEMMKASIASLARVNEDVYAWIHIDDTIIDYPVVRGDDNDYYLNHAFTGEPLSVGSIFADYKLKDYILDNRNTVFYGHNSSTGKMFADIMKFAQSEEFFNTHLIYVYTSTGLYVYEPFNLSMFSYDYPYFRTSFAGDDAFLDFCTRMQSQSMYSKKMTFTADDHILTLSTCTKTGIKSLRYCLQAKLIEVTE